MNPQITQISQIADRSVADLDVWGGEQTTPVLIPKPGEPCVLQDEDGRCPDGCQQCLDFAEHWANANHIVGATHASPGGHGA